MTLKPQPRRPKGSARKERGASRTAPRTKGRGARRPGVPVRQRLTRRLPSIRRVLAGLAATAAAAGLVALLNGPWLRVQEFGWSGAQYTAAEEVESLLDDHAGQSVLSVDTRAIGARLERLPAVADAVVLASLTGRVEATLTEHEAAFVWGTSTASFLGAEDGSLFAALPGRGALPDNLAGVPRITDERRSARLVAVGDQIPAALLETTRRILAIDPAALGSRATSMTVRIDDEHGFRLLSDDPGWEIALGVYGTDPRVTPAEAAARLERQVTAVRTLFAEEPEDGIGWVDVRNPGKVYFRAKG